MASNKKPLSDEQVTDVVKRRRGANWVKELTDTGGENMQPGENARYVRYAIASWGLPPIDISDPKQVEERIGLYFKYCADNDRKPQVVGMCNWLGISRDTLNTWVRGEVRSATHTDMIKKAYGVMEEMWVDYMQNGKVSPPTGIFLAKNWYGYRDVADVVVTPQNPYQNASDQELKDKYITDMTDE